MTGNPDEQSLSAQDKEGESSPEEGGEPYKKVAHGSAVILLGTVAGLGLGFLARVVPARLLGPEGYGLLVLAFTVTLSLSILGKMGLHVGVARNLPRYGSLDERRGIVLSAFTLSLPVSILLAAALIIGAEHVAVRVFDDPDLTPIIRIFAAGIPFLSLQQLSISVFRGEKSAVERVLIENLFNPGGRMILITLAILLGFGILGAAVGWIAGIVLAALLGVYLLRHKTGLLRFAPFLSFHRELLLFSLPLMVTTAMGLVLQQADNLLLGFFMSSRDVGVYDASFTVGRLVTAALGGFGFIFMPVFSELHHEGRLDEMSRLYGVVTKWIVSLTLPAFFVIVLFPEALLTFLFGGEYAAGVLPLRIIAAGFFVNVLFGLCGQSLISLGYTRYVMWGNIGAGAINIVLNLALIPVLGIVGAAAASAAAYVGFNVFYLLKLYRATGIQPFSLTMLRPIIYASVSILTITWAARSFLDISFWMLPALFAVFVAVYVVMFVAGGGVEEEDIEILLAVERRSGIDLTLLKRAAKRIQR